MVAKNRHNRKMEALKCQTYHTLITFLISRDRGQYEKYRNSKKKTPSSFQMAKK